VLNVKNEILSQKKEIGGTIVTYMFTRRVDRSDGVSSVTHSAQEQSITEANEMSFKVNSISELCKDSNLTFKAKNYKDITLLDNNSMHKKFERLLSIR
jgi:hypothetical protein